MSEQINVNSVDALMHFRGVLIKFAERVTSSLLEADAEMAHALYWLQGEQQTFWKRKIHSLTGKLKEAKAALSAKLNYSFDDDRKVSTADEEKRVAKLKRQLEDAEGKLILVKKWTRQMDQEILMCKGQLQALTNLVDGDLKVATAKLDRMIIAIEKYLQTTMPSDSPPSSTSQSSQQTTPRDIDDASSMSRGGIENRNDQPDQSEESGDTP